MFRHYELVGYSIKSRIIPQPISDPLTHSASSNCQKPSDTEFPSDWFLAVYAIIPVAQASHYSIHA
jgi:hypothetical protein